MAKKNKFNLNSPSLGQLLVREAMTPYSEGFDISQLPLSYGINEFTTEQEVPVVEEAKDNKRSLAEDIVWNTGKLITNVLDNANPLYQYIQKERLSVGLSKLQDNLMETESKWIPQILEARNYLEAKSIVDNISNNILTDELKIAVQTVNLLEPNIKEYAKSNPYLRDLFYDTDPTNVNGSIVINFKALLNDFKDNNIFNVNPLDNIATALEDNALNLEEQDFLWNNKLQQMSDKERLDAILKVLSDANDEYEDKTAKIVKRLNTLKKGNWLYDPTALTKEFELRVNESELSITDPKSWFYNLGHIGSSLSEIEMMFLQTGTSILANKAARSLAVRGAITAVPGIGQAATAIALGESAFNLWLAKYYRQSETASEVFDNYQQRVLQSANDNKTDVNRVLESWEPRLGELGYPVDLMDENEKLQAGLAQGLTTDQKDFEEIRNDAFDGLQMVRDVNDALSYSDYLQSMPFSYGGKILWNLASKALAKARGIERPLDEIPSVVDLIGLGKAIDRGVENILNKASRHGQNITRKHLLENIGKFAKANAINFVSERSEEGVQSVVGSRYQRGEYDYLKDKGINPISAAYNTGLLGYEANLAYFGLSNDNYLNTDDELKKAMDIGGFIGLVMPFAGNAVQLKNAVRQYASDKEVQKLIAKGYSNAEQDNKMDVFLDALQAGKDINYVTDYLESAKKLKQPGVTDEMIDEDKNLATNLWAEYRNKSIDENLKDLGIKRGSSEHRKIVKNYLHIKDRLNEAEQSTNDVAKELEKIIEQGKTNKDDVFLQKARESYDAFVESKRLSDEDYQYKMNATPEYADEIEQDFLSTLPTFDEYSNAVYDITYLKLLNQAITDLYKALTNRTKTLQQLSEDTGLDVDLRNINNMRNYIKREKERIERNVQQIVSTYGIQNLDLAQDPVNAELIKNYVTAFVMNKAVRDRLRDQATAYITGKLKAESYLDIKGYLFKDLSEEQLDNIIQEYTDKALREGKPQPSRKSIISKYNQQAQMKYNDLLELADQERASRIVANSLFAEHLSKSVRLEKVARKEKEEAGEVLPEEGVIENPAAAIEDTTKKQEKVEVKPETPIQEGIQQLPVVQETKTETAEPVIPESMSTDVDEILREEEQALLNQKGRLLEIEPSSEDVLVEGSISPQKLELEDIRNRTLLNPDEVSGVSEQTSEEVPKIAVATDAQEANEEQNTNTKDKSNPVPPTPTQVEDSKPAQDAPTITIVDGGIYVNNGTTFISDEVLAAEARMLEDTSTEVYGETGYANMKPETVTNNSDALSNRKVLKVKHVSNTFFFQPDNTSPMNITVNGKPITFTNSKGEVIPVLPGKELSKRLLKNGWINSVNAYYIVTNHRYGDTSLYMQAIHLVLEDTDGVMIASLRTPDYVDKEIASGNYNSEQVQLLQKQKEKLIEIRQQIVNAYLGSNKTIPTTIIKSVKPAKLRISNGEFNNQKSPEEAPVRRKLTEVNDFGLEQNNVRKLDQQVKELQIGYGTGSVKDFVTETFVIRKLGSNDELAGNGVGKSGALYIFPKAEQTPNGSIAPIQLSIHKLDYDIYGDEVELGKDGKVNSLAELAYKLLIGKVKLGGAEQDVLDIIVYNGSKTIIGDEVGEKYPFLMDKMLYYHPEEGNTHIQFAVRNSNGRYIKVEFDPSRASESQHKLAIRKIAKDLHWNTDKYALLEPIPDSIVRLATSYFKQYPNAKQFKIAGLDQLAFTREDLGIGTDEGPVSLLTWLINTGKIETDLGDTIYRAPFIYTDGVAVPQVTETEMVNMNKPLPVLKLVKETSTKQVKQDNKPVSTNGIEYVSTNENWSEEQIKDWMKANSPQYKYKTGKWQIIRRNGKLQAAQKLAKRGLTSQVKGEGKLNVDEARQWLQDKLGIDKSDVVTSEAVFRMANAPQVYGALKVCMDRLSGDIAARIFLSEQSGQGVEFHEGFHYVSLLLINDKLREQVYQDYVKQYPYLRDASKQEVEEALAEEFRQYMLNETRPSIAYRVKKLFNTILKVLGITRNGDLVRTLFNKIRKGEFSKYKPSKSTLEDFEKRFGGTLYYYVPGVEDKELKKIASIADATTFYAVVDSLNATVMDTFNISSIEDLQSLPKKINDIFDDILTTNLELGMYDESQEQLIKDVINNKEVFKKQIDDYLRNFSIIKKNTEESEEQEREERELGDNPDNTWDKESYTISKKANVAFKAKLFFYSIPKTKYLFDPETGNKYLVEEEDDLLMTTRSEDFNVVWNKILENLWNVESYLDLVDKCYNLGKVDPFFMTVYNKLTSKDDPIDEVTLTQILNTVKSAKNSLTAIIVERKQIPFAQRGSDEQIEYATQEYSNKLKWRIQNSDVYRKISRLPKKWSQLFFLSDLIDVNEDGTRTINQDKFHSAVWKHKILIDNVLKKKDKTLDDYIKVRSNFIDMCNNLSINMDDLALDYLLTNGTGLPNMQSFENFWRSANASTSLTKSILNNINIAAIRGTSSIKSRSGETARTFDRIFTSRKPDALINLMAIAWGRTHPSPEEFSVTGADGNLVYPITENNYMSDQIRWLKYNLNGKRELLGKNPYSANSLLLQSINSNADLIKLNTYLNLEENLQNTNRDYFGISPIEDYLSKMTFGFNNHLFCPTMSDKKTWHTISGIQMVKDFLPSTAITDYEYNENGDITRVIFLDQKRRFSDRTLNIFKGYLRDEYNAILKYFATKQSVIDNPNLSVGNYHGSKKGKFSDGNGGRFRYFNKITINGDTYNLNEILAKAEYSNDSQSIQDILSVIKLALDNDTVIKEAINNLLVDYVNNEISKAIELGVIGEDLSNKYIPINFVEEFEKISSKTDSRDKGTDVIYSIIASHAINSAISTIEIEKCFTGDPALYKWQKELMIYKPNDDSFVPVISDERTLEAWIDKHDPDGDKSSYSAYYMITGRDVDKIKRLSSVLSTGTNLRTKWGDTKDLEDRSDSKFQVLLLSDNEIGSTVYDTLYSMFRKSLIKDMFQKEFGVTDLQALNAVKDDHAIESTLGRLRKKNPDAIKFIEQQAKNSAKPYADGEINQADAAVYIRPEFYKRLMKSLGEWSPEIEEAYNIMESDDSWLSDTEKYQKAIKAITQPLKMVYFGDHFDLTLGMNVNTFDKMALFPLFKTFAKADNKYLYDRMNDASKGYIDMVAFESAIKVGGRKKLSFYKDGKVNLSELTSNSDIDGISGKGLATYTLDLTQIRLQLNTDPHEHLERSFGTQAIKIGFANVVDTRTYGENKGLAVKGSEIKKNIMDAINSLSRIGLNKIRKEFFTNGKVDNRKIVNYLLRLATNSGMSAEIIANLTVDENGNIIVPIEAQSIRDWIQTKITSFVNKAVVDVNTPGGSAIQMSSFAYEAVGRSVKTDAELGSAFNQGKKLKFLAKEGHMQVILSENFFRDILPEELKNASFYNKRKWLIDNGIIGSRIVDGVEVESKPYGIGYRIPTLGLSSMFSFQVADIMPTTIGDTIIVPEEFTAMTGSDFDVDKLYLATYTYKDGKRVSSDEKSEQGYVNKLLDNYSLVLTDFTNIAETRASIDTLTKILQKQILPIVQPKNTVEVNPMYELAPSFLLSRKTEYTGGKAGIAPFALNSTNHALTQFTHLCINYSNANRYNLGQLDLVYGEDDQRIMDWLSALINAHVDVAKDPYIMALNVNSITYNMTSLLIRGGKGENTFYFLAQPALRRFTKEMLESKGVIGAEKGITERDKLKSIAKEYMTSLREAIVSLDDSDSNKAKYALYYNSLASEYSLPSIEGYDAVEVNYNDVFDKKVASEALKKPKEVNGLYQQVISIRAYQDLSSDTEVLSNLVQLSLIDTKKFGNTLPLQLNFKRRLNRYIDNYQSRFYINGADNIEKPINYYLSSTFLKQKLDAGINTPRILLSGQIIEATKGYKTIFNAACDFFLGNSSDKNTVAELSKILTTSLRTKAVVNAVEDFNISDKKFLNMLRGPKSMAKRLTLIKNDLRKRNDLPAIAFNGHIKNELLNYLQEYASDGTNLKYDRIVTADNALTNTATYENRLLSAYQDLLDCEDESIRKFANRLGVYAYLTSFDNRSTDSFFDVITTAWKKQKGYSDAIKAAIEILNNDKLVGMNYFGFNSENMQNNNFTELFTEIARNAYRNDKIVKPYQLSNYDNKYGTLVQIKPDSKPMPAVFSSWRANQPFIKIQLNPDDINSYILYQKVATVYQTDENGDPVKNTKQSVYKIIPALGTKDDRKVYYEYQKQSGEQSAFEENALPKEAIWNNGQIEQLVLKFFEPMTNKNHTTLVYESSDAIVINTVEKQEIVSFEEPEVTTVGSDLEASNEIHNTEDTLSSTTYGEVDEQVSTITVGQDDSVTLSDMQVDMEDGTLTIISDDVLNFTEITDDMFGESPYFDSILNAGITQYELVQDIITDMNTGTDTVQDMKFNDEAYKNCKGK
ncbi:nuclear pore complex protein-like protein [uncultured phage cr6_1]|uniref:Nuclear pore complex protein-like protein n=4 Tax=root TaxID=1 RepID=A0A7M1RU79_9CAUD|nr:nuclear pore complex protein-like protein [uncultured phage cr6_1]QOR57259.1 nuclear pore complex protein-like protein [uncultured phage cr6_1]